MGAGYRLHPTYCVLAGLRAISRVCVRVCVVLVAPRPACARAAWNVNVEPSKPKM